MKNQHDTPPPPTKRYILISVLLLALFLLSFFIFAQNLSQNRLFAFDDAITIGVQSLISPRLTIFMKICTFLGSPLFLILLLLISAIAMFIWKKRWEAFFLIIGLAGGAVFNSVLKWIFHRQRPTLNRLIEESGYSFPSGHSMNSIVLYGMLALLCHLFLRQFWPKFWIVAGTLVLVLLIGISRIYLGVHYPSDVLAGFAAGASWLIICLIALRLILEWRRRRYPADQKGPE
ncbi:phosphatase PAP2 family protein [Brevibacillus ruminantium]|uniref:Phosphatase PAP2 family protein n=1 Tax=Brevibacillus ruminantium TaxID=2950604 RepID=A0ABY4WM60_9BACL|nr:phosphatase PAP2 family protein [Brevibacillus ruminantium]USG68250.1 phosphatase PAP2 family protein [Brevibacillus ruminantium]